MFSQREKHVTSRADAARSDVTNLCKVAMMDVAREFCFSMEPVGRMVTAAFALREKATTRPPSCVWNKRKPLSSFAVAFRASCQLHGKNILNETNKHKIKLRSSQGTSCSSIVEVLTAKGPEALSRKFRSCFVAKRIFNELKLQQTIHLQTLERSVRRISFEDKQTKRRRKRIIHTQRALEGRAGDPRSSLNFEIWYFSIKFLEKKIFLLASNWRNEIWKIWNEISPVLEKVFLVTPWKNPLLHLTPGKKSFARPHVLGDGRGRDQRVSDTRSSQLHRELPHAAERPALAANHH